MGECRGGTGIVPGRQSDGVGGDGDVVGSNAISTITISKAMKR